MGSNLIKRVISLFVVLSLTVSNLAYAIPTEYKLAAPSLVHDLGIREVTTEYMNSAVLNGLLSHAAGTNTAIREKSGEIDSDLARAMTGIEADSCLYGLLHSIQKPSERAFYIVYPYPWEGATVLHRYHREGESAADPLFEIVKTHVKQTDTVTIQGEDFIHEIILVPQNLYQYLASLKFPGEFEGGAKSLSYNSDPVSEREIKDADAIIGQFDETGQVETHAKIKCVDDFIRDYPKRSGINYEFKFVPDIVLKNGRVCPAYSKKIEEGKYVIYLSKYFAERISACCAKDAMTMLINHELNEIEEMEAGKSRSDAHKLAEAEELLQKKISIQGVPPMSYLDAFIYYMYSEELKTRDKPWWNEFHRWIIWEKIRLIIISEEITDKAKQLDDMKDEIFSLYPELNSLDKEKVSIKTSMGKEDEITLWKFTLNLLQAIYQFEKQDKKYFHRIGRKNFDVLREYTGFLFTNPENKELLWLAVLFSQIGKAVSPERGKYYSVGGNFVKKVLAEYCKLTGKNDETAKRFAGLGGGLAEHYGDVRAMNRGYITPQSILSSISGIKDLNETETDILLKLINLFSVMYTQERSKMASLNGLVADISINTRDISGVKGFVGRYNYEERIKRWMKSEDNRADFISAAEDIISSERREDFNKFLSGMDFFNFTTVIREITKRMEEPKDDVKYAEVLVKALYFFMRISEKTGAKWIKFTQENLIEEDVINAFRFATVKDIDDALSDTINIKNIAKIKEGERHVILGIPLYAEGSNLVVDIKREGVGVEHGINRRERLLSVAVNDTKKPLSEKYYDVLVIVTDAFSASQMRELAETAVTMGFIPKDAKVVIVSQPANKITGNWSAIANLMCNPRLKVEDKPGIQLLEEDRINESGVQLGDYLADKNTAVVLSAGTGSRNYPLTVHGFGDKGKMSNYAGQPYLFQVFRQVMYCFNPGRRGMFVTSNDGTKCVANELERLGIEGQGFQVIGAAKPAIENGNYNKDELGELGCMRVTWTGRIEAFEEKPDERKWREKLGARLSVPTNWADYYISIGFLKDLREIFNSLKDSEGNLLYVRYGLDTSKDFSEIATGKYRDVEEYVEARKGKGWNPEDARVLYRAAGSLAKRHGIGFVDAGADAYFKDTGTNETFMALARDVLKDDKLRLVLGMTEGNGYRIVGGNNLIGPNVRLGVGVKLVGKNNVIVGNVAIESGNIGDNCVIIDTLAKRVEMKTGTMAYGIFEPDGELRIDRERVLVSDVFLMSQPESDLTGYGFKEIRLLQGLKTIKYRVVLPIDVKPSDKIRKYTVKDKHGKEQLIYVREGSVVEGEYKDKPVTDSDIGQSLIIDRGDKDKTDKIDVGVVTNIEENEVWRMNIWPRDPKREGDHPRIDEVMHDKIALKDLAQLTDRDALSAFRELLREPWRVLRIDHLRYGEYGQEESMVSEADKKVFGNVSIIRMTPEAKTKTQVSATDDFFGVNVEVEMGSIDSAKLIIEAWFGEKDKPETWEAIPLKLGYVKNSVQGICVYSGLIPLAKFKDSKQIGVTSRIRLKGEDPRDFTRWYKRPGEDAVLEWSVPTGQRASLLMRKVRAGEIATPLWQAGLKEDGTIIGNGANLAAEHPKLSQIDLEKYGKSRAKLVEKYNLGVFGAVDGIIVVDNLQEKTAGDMAPYFAVATREDGKKYVMIDVDSFTQSDDVFYMLLDHELKHSVLELLEDSPALEELAAIVMSLEDAIKAGYEKPTNLVELSPEARFWNLLDELKKIEPTKRTEALIVSYAVEYMRTIPVYKTLFDQLGLSETEWRKAVEEAKGDVRAAIEVYNQFAGIKPVALIETVQGRKDREKGTRERLTAVAGVKVPEAIASAAKKLKMVASIWSNNADFVDGLIKSGEILELDIEKLRGEENAGLLDWVKEVSRNKDNPFMFYSSKKGDVDAFLKDNQLQQAALKSGAVVTRFIDILDLENTDTRADNRRYVALPYSRSGVYLAARVAAAKGEVGQLDNLTKTTLERIYTIFKTDFNETDWNTIFTAPWSVLPPVSSMMGLLNNLRGAMAAIDAAA